MRKKQNSEQLTQAQWLVDLATQQMFVDVEDLLPEHKIGLMKAADALAAALEGGEEPLCVSFFHAEADFDIICVAAFTDQRFLWLEPQPGVLKAQGVPHICKAVPIRSIWKLEQMHGDDALRIVFRVGPDAELSGSTVVMKGLQWGFLDAFRRVYETVLWQCSGPLFPRLDVEGIIQPVHRRWRPVLTADLKSKLEEHDAECAVAVLITDMKGYPVGEPAKAFLKKEPRLAGAIKEWFSKAEESKMPRQVFFAWDEAARGWGRKVTGESTQVVVLYPMRVPGRDLRVLERALRFKELCAKLQGKLQGAPGDIPTISFLIPEYTGCDTPDGWTIVKSIFDRELKFCREVGVTAFYTA